MTDKTMKMKNTLIAVILMLLTSIGIQYMTSSTDQALKKNLSLFPMQIEDWNGVTTRFDDEIYEVLGVDDSILANYNNQTGDFIQVYVGYYKSQREGEIIHSPKNCMPGSGWKIIETSIVPISIKNSEQQSINVIKLTLQKGIQRQIAIYWYQSRGRIIASEYAQKIYLVWDSLTKHRTDGSFIRLLSPVSDKGETYTMDTLKEFTAQLYPILNNFIPT